MGTKAGNVFTVKILGDLQIWGWFATGSTGSADHLFDGSLAEKRKHGFEIDPLQSIFLYSFFRLVYLLGSYLLWSNLLIPH